MKDKNHRDGKQPSDSMINSSFDLFSDADFMEQVVDVLPVVLMVLDVDGRMVFSNHHFLNVFNIDAPARLQGVTPGEAINCVHAFKPGGGCGTTEHCRYCWVTQSLEAIRNGNPVSEREVGVRRRVGSPLDFRIWAKGISLRGNDYVVFLAENISDEKRRRILEKVFFHDVLNLAGGARSIATLLDETPDEASRRKLLDSLTEALDGLYDEIKAQKDLSSAESGELLVEPFVLDSLSILESVRSVYANTDAGDDKTVTIDDDARGVEFVSDGKIVKRCLGNLLKNALEASSPGETVTLGCGPVDAAVEFTVHNSSPIPEDVQKGIFSRYVSTKGYGRGIGTYSVQLFVEKFLEGTVSFTSSPTVGTVFRVRLPISREIPS